MSCTRSYSCARTPLVSVCAVAALAAPALADPSRNILITGFWPPTNNMLRGFSPLPGSNPGGWIGQNWEGRGYNVYAHFPEFPGQTGPSWGKGEGDMEVDYQDVAADFARLTNDYKPVAIITFSRSNTSIGWELEPAYQRFRLPGEATSVNGRTIPTYAQDYAGVLYPSDVPIASEPLGNIRLSNLPMQSIVDAVSNQVSSSLLSPFIDVYDPNSSSSSAFGGNFVSGYTGYLGTWYRDQHLPGMSTDPVYAAGHIHVGTSVTTAAGEMGTAVTLRTLISHLDSLGVPAPGAAFTLVLTGVIAARRSRGVPSGHHGS